MFANSSRRHLRTTKNSRCSSRAIPSAWMQSGKRSSVTVSALHCSTRFSLRAIWRSRTGPWLNDMKPACRLPHSQCRAKTSLSIWSADENTFLHHALYKHDFLDVFEFAWKLAHLEIGSSHREFQSFPEDGEEINVAPAKH